MTTIFELSFAVSLTRNTACYFFPRGIYYFYFAPWYYALLHCMHCCQTFKPVCMKNYLILIMQEILASSCIFAQCSAMRSSFDGDLQHFYCFNKNERNLPKQSLTLVLTSIFFGKDWDALMLWRGLESDSDKSHDGVWREAAEKSATFLAGLIWALLLPVAPTHLQLCLVSGT